MRQKCCLCEENYVNKLGDAICTFCYIEEAEKQKTSGSERLTTLAEVIKP